MRRLATRLAALALLIVPASCARLPERPQISAAVAAVAVVPGYDGIRYWADAPVTDWRDWHRQWVADRAAGGRPGHPEVLAISSGSDKGAFAAGYLTGWSASGSRPVFDLVSGVSTGALIAPFAFLGPDGDAALKELYTQVTARDIYRATPIKGLLGGPALADNRPLVRLIERHVTPAMLDRVAAAHRNGRRLLVMTANLDSARGIVWDMGAIAASNAPDRLTLFRRVLLASASIPGFFPPVFIDVTGQGQRFAELHVDGATIASLFVLPPAILWGDAATPATTEPRRVTLLYNGKLDPDFRVVKPRAATILTRALSTVLTEADRAAIVNYQRLADARRVPLNVRAIGLDFDRESPGLFDRDWMRALFDYGEAAGRRETR